MSQTSIAPSGPQLCAGSTVRRLRPAPLDPKRASICVLPRAEAVRRICRGYAHSYGADVSDHIMPRLFGVREETGALSAVFGLRSDSEPLYLERYLPDPLLDMARRIDTNHGLVAGELVELGNLVGERPGALRLLVALLSPALFNAGKRWLACTATRQLRNGLQRAGTVMHAVAPARADVLETHEAEHWGTYYQHDPMVMLIDIAATLRCQPDMGPAQAARSVPVLPA